MQLHDYVGIFGVILYLFAYGMVQLGRLSLEDPGYGLINIVACGCGMFSLAHDFNLSSFLSQGMWLMLTLVGMYRGYQRRRSMAMAASMR
ncbi:CBU_0592 family membrane protein [Leeia oryzae]|uniref:CBU_0592 family membrane protein n=1 Tax=Leeia oryzae TaxID=356662 RepID=UPI00036D929C|nr:hypothetical protein [Leeia oryzae]